MSVHQSLARAASLTPDHVAIDHDGRQISWRSFVDRVARRAGALLSSGMRAGDRLGVIAANVPEHFEIGMAALWAGLVLVPLNTRMSSAEQCQVLRHSGCTRLFHDQRQAERARLLSRETGIPTTALEAIGEWGTSADSVVGHSAVEPASRAMADDAAIFYTGGTTGMPKGVVLSHGSLWIQALSAMQQFRLDESSVYLHATPLFHLADFATSLGVNAACGRHAFLAEFSPAAMVDAIERHRVSFTSLIPTMIPLVLDAAEGRKPGLQTVRTLLYGAAPIQEPVLRRLLQALPEVEILQVYGQTEIGGACTTLRPEYHRAQASSPERLASAGQPIPAFRIRIVDPEGRDVPEGTVGEILIGGPGVMSGYWQEPALTAAALRNGWVYSGDLGRLDAQGFLTIAGRLKDMIITGGENVFAGEVENALMHHPAVEAAAVVGVPDAKWGESVHAAVVLRRGMAATTEELIAHCRGRIAGYKCPRSIEIRSTPLPLSGVGKVRKIELRQAWIDRQTGEAHA